MSFRKTVIVDADMVADIIEALKDGQVYKLNLGEGCVVDLIAGSGDEDQTEGVKFSGLQHTTLRTPNRTV